MNDKGEKTCPLCAEEMDLTDQYLKPCKCGYEICVWCWNHIIGMAEKDKTEGRCPACRTPYDKEKIVGMTANRDSLAAELNNDRKKPQKGKPKPSEGRKNLTGVRVIQRNLVYVLSMPLDLADEDLFQRREYFGQYGNVVKVALSRTAGGAVQQFPNDTCSVYITYSKEEEAIRCIRSVHGFVLDGRPLKACFGTMKYCHAWLRNMPCTNSECFYLHENGAEKDSFPKDEAISMHMRNIVQQITGVAAYFPRCSGSMLPPPVDEYVDNESSTRQISKCGSNSAHSVVKSSLPNVSNGRSVTLPAGALWGMHSSSQSSAPNTPCSKEPLIDKADTVSSAVATNSSQISRSDSDVSTKPSLEDSQTAYEDALRPLESLDSQTDFPELSLFNRTQNSKSRALVSASEDDSRAVSVPSHYTDFREHTSQLSENGKINRRNVSVCSNGVPLDADSVVDGYSGVTRSDSLHLDHASIESSLQRCFNETRENRPLQRSDNRAKANEVVVLVPREEVKAGSPLVTDCYLEDEDDISLFNRQRLNDPEVLSCQPNVAYKAGFLSSSNCMQPSSSQYKSAHDESGNVFGYSYSDKRGSNIAPISHGTISPSEPSLLNGSLNQPVQFPDKARDTQGDTSSEIDERIMANLMSLDLDEYLTSHENLSRLLGRRLIGRTVEVEVENSSVKPSSSSEVNNNQSRFSFARQEASSKDQSFESYNVFNQIPHGSDLYKNTTEQQSPDMNMLGMYNGISSSYLEGIDHVSQNSNLPSSYKSPAVPRYPVAAPPGFSVPSRPPPPGFASNGREQQSFNGFSGNHRLSDSKLFGSPYQSLPIENNGSGVRDVQFIDPAIMAVGRQGFENASLDFRPNLQGNTNIYGHPEAMPQQQQQQQQQRVVMQSPLSLHQNGGFANSTGNNNNNKNWYGHTGLIDQTQGKNLALPNNNGHWDDGSRLQNDRLNRSSNHMNGYNGGFGK
ncbi:unnamed protein product [Cochlearia groenlandica]